MSLYLKMLLCVGLLALVLLGFIIAKSQLDTDRIIAQKEDEIAQMATDVVPRRLHVSYQVLQAAMGQLVLNQPLLTAFADKDREKLAILTQPATQKLARSDISLYQFHLPDNSIFFQAQNPNSPIGKPAVPSPMVAMVNRQQQTVVGLQREAEGLAMRHLEPIFIGDDYVGVIELGMLLDQRILEIWKRAVQGEWYLYEINRNGARQLAATTDQECRLQLTEDHVTQLLAGEELHLRLNDNVIQLIPLPNFAGQFSYYVQRRHDNTEIMTLAKAQRNTSIIYGLLMVGPGFLLLAFTIRFFLNPLLYLAEMTQAFAAGKLERPIAIKSNDEIGLLATIMENMRQTIYDNQRELEHLSLHDKLTGLHNRAFLESEMQRFEGSREYPLTMIVIDMDNLKQINDAFGHQKGDHIIKKTGELLKSCLRREDILARLGGDEFVALMPATDYQTGFTVAKRIQQAADSCGGEDCSLGLSIGVATTSTPQKSLEQVMKEADDAMYEDKRRRKGKDPDHC